MSIFYHVRKSISNLPGWSTDRKIVVFESDDWGSVRMSSIDGFDRLEKLGLDMRSQGAERYNRYDSLASKQDLESLFNVLLSFKDINGNNPAFSVISLVANPDFNKIREANFEKYYYEPFTETLKMYKGCENSFNLWKEGIQKKIFVPQMHGREHLNVSAWMNALRNDDRLTKLAFDEGVWGFIPDTKTLPGIYFQPAFLLFDPSEIDSHRNIIIDGLNLFERIFGYKAEYFVPPNGMINNKLNRTLVENGVKFRSISKIQIEPLGNGNFKKHAHWIGQRDKFGITYITRNCLFEPSEPGRDWLDVCISDVRNAFLWRKPAIISTHRVNYIGSLVPANRENGLRQLNNLIKVLLNKWPDVEFMSTTELGHYILRN